MKEKYWPRDQPHCTYPAADTRTTVCAYQHRRAVREILKSTLPIAANSGVRILEPEMRTPPCWEKDVLTYPAYPKGEAKMGYTRCPKGRKGQWWKESNIPHTKVRRIKLDQGQIPAVPIPPRQNGPGSKLMGLHAPWRTIPPFGTGWERRVKFGIITGRTKFTRKIPMSETATSYTECRCFIRSISDIQLTVSCVSQNHAQNLRKKEI